MPLPRPARIARQPRSIGGSPSCRFFSSKGNGTTAANAHTELKDNVSAPRLAFAPDWSGTCSVLHSEPRRSYSTNLEGAAASGSSSQVDGPEEYADVLIRQIDQIGSTSATDGSLVDPLDPESRREERRSPAAVMGSKKIGSVVLPYEMELGIQSVVDGVDHKLVRQNYLDMISMPYSSHIRKKTRNPIPQDENPIAKAAAFLPGEYAAVRNVIREIRQRLPKWTLGDKDPKVVEFTGGLGPGMWVILDELDLLPSAAWMSPVSRRNMRELDRDELEDLRSSLYNYLQDAGPSKPADSRLQYQMIHSTLLDTEIMKKILGDRSIPIDVEWNQKLNREVKERSSAKPPAMALSTFHLSTLRLNERERHYKELLATKADWIVIVDHTTADSWTSISEARTWFTDLPAPLDGAEPWRIFAPCPHDGACPLAGTREICHFAQRLQAPGFLRKTKHSKKGDAFKSYTYLVLTREPGARSPKMAQSWTEAGYLGGVAKDRLRSKAADLYGQDAKRIVPVEDSEEYKVVIKGNLLQKSEILTGIEWKEPGLPRLEMLDALTCNEGDQQQSLRTDAYHWPRILAAPMKRSGHVILDTCDPNGQLQRITISKSHSKQGYHDARKAQWGDLFPHESKLKVVPRDRGIKKLTPEGRASGEESSEVMSEIFAASKDGYGDVELPEWLQNMEASDDGSGVQIRETVSKGLGDYDLPQRRKKKGDRRDGDRRSPKRERVLNATAFDPADGSISARRDVDSWTTADKPSTKHVKGVRLGRSAPETTLADSSESVSEATTSEEPVSIDLASRDPLDVEDGEARTSELEGYKDISSDLNDSNIDEPSPTWLADRDARAEIISSTSSPGEATVIRRLDENFHVVEEIRLSAQEGSTEFSDAEYNALKKDLQGILTDAGAGRPSTKVGNTSQAPIPGRRSYSTVATARVGLHYARHWAASRRHMSVRPRENTNGNTTSPPRAKVTISELHSLKAQATPISVLTAYDYPTALLSESSGVDITLVGDSLSQVALGYEETTRLKLDEMIHHCRAVTRGAKTPFVIADLPFGSFESSIEKGMDSVIRLIKEGGVDGVKIEGGDESVPLVRHLAEYGMAVMPHLGLRPQRATSTSGYLVQGRTAESAAELLRQAKAMEAAGATLILLEAVPHSVASHVTQHLSIPTIGIGAGNGTDGQVLVITDILGIYAPDETLDGSNGHRQPRFVRQFGNIGADSRRAVRDYLASVKDRSFPETGKETYGMKKEEWDVFVARSGGDVPPVVASTRLTEGKQETGEETEDGA